LLRAFDPAFSGLVRSVKVFLREPCLSQGAFERENIEAQGFMKVLHQPKSGTRKLGGYMNRFSEFDDRAVPDRLTQEAERIGSVGGGEVNWDRCLGEIRSIHSAGRRR
jgi:hypothetical protein